MQKRSKNIILVLSVIIIISLGIILSITIYPGARVTCPIESSPPGAFTLDQPDSPDSDGIIYLTWTDSKRVCRYRVWRRDVSANGEWVMIAERLGPTTTAYTDSGRPEGRWEYKIQAKNMNSAWQMWYTSTSSKFVDVEIPEENVIPIATINHILPDPAVRGEDTIVFSGYGTDTDGSISEYHWESSINGFLSDEYVFTKSASSLSLGTHTIYFKVKDNSGDWSEVVSEDLTINNPPLPNVKPTAIINSIEPISATQGIDTITFKGSGIDTDGNIVAYQWLLTGGVVIGESATITKPADDFNVGDITIYFKVRDDDGEWSDRVSEILTIIEAPNEKPTATIISITPTFAEQGVDTVTFNGSGSDTDGTITEYEWSSSIDGTLSSLSSFSESADELSLGTHIIYFSVKDNDNEWSEQLSMSLIIREEGIPPPEEPIDLTVIIILVFVIIVGITSIYFARKLRKKV